MDAIDRRQALRGGSVTLAGGLVTLLGLQRVLKTGSVDVRELSRKAAAVHEEFATLGKPGTPIEIEPFRRMAEVLALTAQLAVELRDAELG